MRKSFILKLTLTLLMLTGVNELFAQFRHGRTDPDEVYLEVRHAGRLSEDFPKEMFDRVRVLHLRGSLNNDDLRFLRRLADRTKVVDATGKSVKAYLDLDLAETRLAQRGLFGGDQSLRAIPSSTFSSWRLLRRITLPFATEVIGERAFSHCSMLEQVDMARDVTTIEAEAFYNCRRLRHINLPRDLQVIGDECFKGCDDLNDIYLPDGLEVLGTSAFEDCRSLAIVSIPFRLSIIPAKAFANTALRKIQIPDNIISIGEYAFTGTPITEFHIPATLTDMSVNSLRFCPRLQNIFVEQGNPNFTDVDGVLYNTDQSQLLQVPTMRSGVFNIPEGVQLIEEKALNTCKSITHINIPASVTLIGAGAFAGTGISSLVLPDGLNIISDEMCYNCSALQELVIPASVTKVGASAFSKCTSLSFVQLPEQVSQIGKKVFSGCSSLTSVQLPQQLTTIPDEMFAECSKLLATNLNEGVTTIGERAYYKCTSLTEVTLPKTTRVIGEEAFRGCKNLTMMKIYEGIQSMADKMVYDCGRLQTFICLCPTPPDVSKVTNEKVALVVPAASVGLYKNAKGWKKFRTVSGI